nr:caspase family protein [uncultured Psychroserpens sp.]
MNLDNAHALLIGVGSDLPVTVTDASALAAVLTDQNKAAYNEENVVLLTEQNATREKVLNALNALIKKTSSINDATVIVYYSGHGGIYEEEVNGQTQENYYLLTNGYDSNNRSETMILGNEFSELIDKIKAKKILVMLDCCHAKGMLGAQPLMKSVSRDQSIANSNIELLRMLRSGEGRIYVTSCDDDEQSVILPGSDNSLFTEVVLEALSGQASNGREYVRVIELLYYILTEVPERIKRFNHVQRPIINKIDFLSPDYYLCKASIESKEASSVSLKMVDEIDDKIKLLIEDYNIRNSHTTIDIEMVEENNQSQDDIQKEESIQKIKKYITQGDTKKAITIFLELTESICTDQRNDVILIAGRYNQVFKQKMTSLISDDNYRIQIAQINMSILYFLELCE